MDAVAGGGGGGGLVSTVIGGILGNNGANSAQRAGVRAGQQSAAEYGRARDASIGYQQPYMGIGQTGLAGLSGIANGEYGKAFDSPFFKARVDFANQQFNDGAAAKYRLFSGGAQNDRDALNQNLASEGIRDYTNFNMGLAGMGQQAANQSGNYQMGAAQGISNGLMGIGQAQAQGAYDRANNWGNTLNGINQSFSSAFGMR